MVNTELRILRVFGPTAAEVSAVLRQARADGCPGLRLLERDGEFAVCVQVSAPNRAMAEQYCEKWVQRLHGKFGDDVFATGETSLAQATLDTLLEKRKLLVAADEGYITNVAAGCGLIRCAGNIVPFENSFPRNTRLYQLMTTKPDEVLRGA